MRPLNVFIIALIFFIQCSFQLKSKLSSSSSSQNNHENNHNQNNDHTELKKQQAELDELLKKYTKDELMVFSLLFQGQNQFNEGKYQECKETFEQMTKLAPTVDYGWSNWGLCLERLGNIDAAIQAYSKGMEHTPKSSLSYNALCTIMLSRGGSEEMTEKSCHGAVIANASDSHAWCNYGNFLVNRFRYDEGISALEKGLELAPWDNSCFKNLATSLNRAGYRYCERAINMSEMLITRTQAAPSSSNYISLAIYRGNCNPFDKAAVEAVRSATQLKLLELSLAPGPANTARKECQWWKIDELWAKREDYTSMRILNDPSGPSAFYKTEFTNPIYWWQEKQTRLLRLQDVYMEGRDGVLYRTGKSCTLFAGDHLCLKIIADENFILQSTKTKSLSECNSGLGCADLVQVNNGNYYHFLIEGVGKMLLFQKNLPFIGDTTDEITYLVPEVARNHYKQILDLVGVKESQLYWYSSESRERRLSLSRLWVLDYKIPYPISQWNDTWSIYQPPRSTLKLIANTFLQSEVISKFMNNAERKPKILYVSRKDAGVRRVKNEELLLDALEREFGEENIDVFVGTGLSITDQIKKFANAKIVIGPHGAAFANLVFCAKHTPILQFPLAPLVDTCFVHIAAAMELDYYLYEPISSYYYGDYNVEQSMIAPFIERVSQLLAEHDKENKETFIRTIQKEEL